MFFCSLHAALEGQFKDLDISYAQILCHTHSTPLRKPNLGPVLRITLVEFSFYHLSNFSFTRCSPWKMFFNLSLKTLVKSHQQLFFFLLLYVTGMTVSAMKEGLGMLIRSIIQGGSISRDGRLGVGDLILAINGEPTANLTNAQARAMLRRHSLIGPEMG